MCSSNLYLRLHFKYRDEAPTRRKEKEKRKKKRGKKKKKTMKNGYIYTIELCRGGMYPYIYYTAVQVSRAPWSVMVKRLHAGVCNSDCRTYIFVFHLRLYARFVNVIIISPLSLSLSLCLYVCLCLSVCLSLSVTVSVCLPACLSATPSPSPVPLPPCAHPNMWPEDLQSAGTRGGTYVSSHDDRKSAGPERASGPHAAPSGCRSPDPATSAPSGPQRLSCVRNRVTASR